MITTHVHSRTEETLGSNRNLRHVVKWERKYFLRLSGIAAMSSIKTAICKFMIASLRQIGASLFSAQYLFLIYFSTRSFVRRFSVFVSFPIVLYNQFPVAETRAILLSSGCFTQMYAKMTSHNQSTMRKRIFEHT